MTDYRLERAIGLVQSGEMEAARELLELLLKQDRHSIPAWHWYAQTWPKAADKILVLEYTFVTTHRIHRLKKHYGI